MSCPKDIASLSREDLRALVAELQRQVMALQEQVAQLTASNQALVTENPFPKGAQVSNPKRPGHKPGEGTLSFRQAPRPVEGTNSATVFP